MYTFLVSIELVALVVVCAGVCVLFLCLLTSRVPEYAARLAAWRMRRKHPSLARKFRYASEKDKFLIAQSMMMADRDRYRLSHAGRTGRDYPAVWDYYIPRGRLGYRAACTWLEARRSEMDALHNRTRDWS